MSKVNKSVAYEKEGELIAKAIIERNISLLREVCPDAQSLVKATENCFDKNHDIMAQLVENNDCGMLKEVIFHYFRERSDVLDDLLMRFLMSHQEGEKPKDFHYFFSKDQIDGEMYTLIKEEYGRVEPLRDPHATMKKRHYEYETYPRIRLVDSYSGRCYDIEGIRFTKGKNDLAQQVYDGMHFPDFWLEKGHLVFLTNLGETCQKIYDDDPLASALIHNFNDNCCFICLENKEDEKVEGNAKTKGYYAYANKSYICLRTDLQYDEGIALHELTHNSDGDDFSSTDFYKLVATAIYLERAESGEREDAVRDTIENYPCSEFEKETLARIPQQCYTSGEFKDDPLLKATYDMFLAYGQAKQKGHTGILARINMFMRLRMSGEIGYEKFWAVYEKRKSMFSSYDESCKGKKAASNKSKDMQDTVDEKCKKEVKQLRKAYMALTGKRKRVDDDYRDVSHLIIEDELIRCVRAELEHIEKIKQHPWACHVKLPLEVISRDNITEDEPLEVVVAKSYENAIKIAKARAQTLRGAELYKQAQIALMREKKAYYEFWKDQKAGMPLDRDLICSVVNCAGTAAIYLDQCGYKYKRNGIGYAVDILHKEETTGYAIIESDLCFLKEKQKPKIPPAPKRQRENC